MSRRIIFLISVALLTGLNICAFFYRWTESAWSSIPLILPYVQTSSILSGLTVGITLLWLVQELRERRWTSLLLFSLCAATLGLLMRDTISFGKLATPVWTSFFMGTVAGLICYSLKEAPTPHKPKNLYSSVALFFIASLNFYLLAAPYSTHLPSIIQDSAEATNLQRFYYGSIHSEIAPVYRWMRGLINFFLPAPTINGTALCSILTASLGLALTAAAVQMTGGTVWAWVFLLLAWCDQWAFALAVNPGTVAMTIITIATMLFMVTWVLTRREAPLLKREAFLIGLALMFLTIFSLYSYSAARFAWATGAAILGVVLLLRGAVSFNLRGILAVALIAAPSAILAGYIWAVIFHGDTAHFQSQLFIGPLPEHLISDRATYTRKYVEVHDNDIPIWWGTGRLLDANASVYWKRSLGEVATKTFSLLKELSAAPPFRLEVPTLAFIAVFIGLTSRNKQRRNISAVWGVFAIIAFAPYIIAQDLSAYRRGCPANVIFTALATLLFAFRARSGVAQALSVIPVLGFAIVRAPIELSPLLDYYFIDPPCVVCQGQVHVKPMVNHPEFRKLTNRNLHFVVIQDHGTQGYYRCISEAISTWEWRSLAPNCKMLTAGAPPFKKTLEQLPAGDIIVVPCLRHRPPTAELNDICEGTNTSFKTVARIEQMPVERNGEWVLAERKVAPSS
jgi:hypothetical protein